MLQNNNKDCLGVSESIKILKNTFQSMKPWLFKLFHNRLFYLVFCVLLAFPSVIIMDMLWLYVSDFNVFLFMLINFYVPVGVTFAGLWIIATVAWALLIDKALEAERKELGYSSAKEARHA